MFDNPLFKRPINQPVSREEIALASRNHSIALEVLRHDVTPLGQHYLLTHFDIPYVTAGEATQWKLRVGGLVEREVSISLDELKRLPQKTLRVTLECAGNGRAYVTPKPVSMPWVDGAVGTSEWTGTSLNNVLQLAGLKHGAVEVAFHGVDRGFDKGIEHNYARSLPCDVAMRDDVILVYLMNGVPLLPQHGFPLRLIVPGYYGMASVKWLNEIQVLAEPFQGFQQVGTYLYKSKPTEPGTPVTHIRVRALMIPPGIPDWFTRQRVVDSGLQTIRGRAWSGNGARIAKIEFGVNDEWQDAVLLANEHKYAWTSWMFEWNAKPGRCVLSCRATDANGNVQPLEAFNTTGGFGNNEVQRVNVIVRSKNSL
jgi:DMSO/TMAO reductase YedYZ molybdopterin-dependent catalytic subunit